MESKLQSKEVKSKSIEAGNANLKEALQLMFYFASQFSLEQAKKTGNPKFMASESNQILFENLAPKGLNES